MRKKRELRISRISNEKGNSVLVNFAMWGVHDLATAQIVELGMTQRFRNKISLSSNQYGHILSMVLPYFKNPARKKRRKHARTK